MNWVAYGIAIGLYGLSLEVIATFDKRAAWAFLGLVTLAIALSYPNLASEVAWLTSSAGNVTRKK